MDRYPLDQTLAALDGGITGLTPAAATGAIDQWTEALAGNETLAGIREGLVELKAALTAPRLDGQAIGALLVRLGHQTIQAGSVGDPSVAASVSRLGAVLHSAGQALTGSATPAPTSSNDL